MTFGEVETRAGKWSPADVPLDVVWGLACVWLTATTGFTRWHWFGKEAFLSDGHARAIAEAVGQGKIVQVEPGLRRAVTRRAYVVGQKT